MGKKIANYYLEQYTYILNLQIPNVDDKLGLRPRKPPRRNLSISPVRIKKKQKNISGEKKNISSEEKDISTEEKNISSEEKTFSPTNSERNFISIRQLWQYYDNYFLFSRWEAIIGSQKLETPRQLVLGRRRYFPQHIEEGELINFLVFRVKRRSTLQNRAQSPLTSWTTCCARSLVRRTASEEVGELRALCLALMSSRL